VRALTTLFGDVVVVVINEPFMLLSSSAAADVVVVYAARKSTTIKELQTGFSRCCNSHNNVLSSPTDFWFVC